MKLVTQGHTVIDWRRGLLWILHLFIVVLVSYLAPPGPVAALGIFDFCCSMWGYF